MSVTAAGPMVPVWRLGNVTTKYSPVIIPGIAGLLVCEASKVSLFSVLLNLGEDILILAHNNKKTPGNLRFTTRSGSSPCLTLNHPNVDYAWRLSPSNTSGGPFPKLIDPVSHRPVRDSTSISFRRVYRLFEPTIEVAGLRDCGLSELTNLSQQVTLWALCRQWMRSWCWY